MDRRESRWRHGPKRSLPAFICVRCYRLTMAQESGRPTATSNPSELAAWLRDGWRLMLGHFPGLVLIALVADVPLSLIPLASDGIDNGLVGFLVTVSSIAVITPLAKAVAIVAIDRWDRNQQGALRAGFGTVLRRLPVVLAASVLWCVLVLLGTAVFILPGIVVLMLGQCLVGGVVLEGRSIRDAARRSVSLVKPRFLNVLCLFVVVQAAAGIASGVVGAVIDVALDGWALDLATRALTSPIAFAPLAVMFLRARTTADGTAGPADGTAGPAAVPSPLAPS